MGLLDQVQKAIGTIGEQITSSSKKPQGVYFTNNFEVKAKQWGLSEKNALDVYYCHWTQSFAATANFCFQRYGPTFGFKTLLRF